MTHPPHPDEPAARPWSEDPVEIDRMIDHERGGGELSDAERRAREADLAADPALAARVEARRAFLERLARAGAAARAEQVTAMPVGLEGRVRACLAGRDGPRMPLLRWAVATAAVLLLGLGAAFLMPERGDDAIAMPRAVIAAADMARGPEAGPQGCRDVVAGNPLRFPPVRDGLRIWACAELGEGTVAKLYRPEELPSVGYAAVPAPGVAPGPTVGRTDLGDTVVFDINYGRESHYIAVRKAWLDRQRLLTPGRESCRACHHLSRVGQENPHRIIERSWKLGTR